MKNDSAANDSPHTERATNGLLKKLLTGRVGYVLAISFALLFTAFAGYRAYSRYAEPSSTRTRKMLATISWFLARRRPIRRLYFCSTSPSPGLSFQRPTLLFLRSTFC